MPDAYIQLPDNTVIATSTPQYWPEAKRLSKAKGKAALAEKSRAELLEILQPGDTVHCVLRHVSRSGMRRRIDFYKMGADGERYLTQYIAWLLDYPCDDHGLMVDGCGMDMGFSVVYNLGATLWPKGTDKPHGTRNGEPDSGGGYALKHRWL